MVETSLMKLLGASDVGSRSFHRIGHIGSTQDQTSVRIRPELGFETAARIRPNSDSGRPSESGRTRIWDDRPNPAELGFGTAARIRPISDWGLPPGSGRTRIGDHRPNPAEK